MKIRYMQFALLVPVAVSAVAQSSWTLPSIQAALRKSGVPTRVDVTVEQPYLSVPGKVLAAHDGTEIQTYIYKSAAEREKDTRQLEPKTAAPATVRPHWLMPVSLVTDKNAALIVLSRDPEVHKKIGAALSGADEEEGPDGLIRRFHEALQQRDLKTIESLVANDLVVFENGERNDGWADFRDHHLIPEMKEPAPETKWELVKVKTASDQAWGYTHETFTSRRGRELVVWSIVVLEKRGTDWKIVMLDWSVGH